jgi:uncharacterized protein (TIGR03437 family)
MGRYLVLACFLATLAPAQPKRILYLTLSAGYRHDSIPASIEVLRALDPARLEVTATEDVAFLDAAALRAFDAVFFFTSGELPLSGAQKTALLDFVRSGKGLGGAHSATDTLYTWPDYAPLIGATFDGHPWVQKVRLDVEDPTNPIVAGQGTGLEIEEEIYQFRNFSRDRVRVLMSMDTTTANMSAAGINRSDSDFASAWVQPYGEGRVFYTALGHFEATWRDVRFQQLLRNALLWLTRQMDAPATPRPAAAPRIFSDAGGPAIGNAATMAPRTLSPGAIITIFGDALTPGSSASTSSPSAPHKLAGATVLVNGEAASILYASPTQINAIAPATLPGANVRIEVASGGSSSAAVSVTVQDRTPGIFAVTADGPALTIWATGLGVGTAAPVVEINGVAATVTYSGLAPGWTGLYQINAVVPAGVAPPFTVKFRD